MWERRINRETGMLPSEASTIKKPVSVTLNSDRWGTIVESLKFRLENDDDLHPLMEQKLENMICEIKKKSDALVDPDD